MVRQGMDELDRAETIHLSYVVSGSGGAGITVMRTTFLGLRQPFDAWLEGQWSKVLPYSDRETIEFPKPYGKIGVYWFDVPETYTFAESFPVQSVITKFGSVPDFYNHLTWITAHIIPGVWMQNPKTIEFLSRISYFMTNITDFFTGVGVGMRVEISGWKNSQPVQYIASMFHENTAVAAGAGAGSVAQLILAGKLHRPGIWPVERVLPSELFTAAMKSRGIIIEASIF
jgi:saccharopine dehydrogenase-like NADP-dependent oxidoreductase